MTAFPREAVGIVVDCGVRAATGVSWGTGEETTAHARTGAGAGAGVMGTFLFSEGKSDFDLRSNVTKGSMPCVASWETTARVAVPGTTVRPGRPAKPEPKRMTWSPTKWDPSSA